MPLKIKEKRWVIMTKDRKKIAKGVPRSRCLCSVDDVEDKQRFLTYTTKEKAESAFTRHGFYGMDDDDEYEAIPVTITIAEGH